MLGFIRTHFGLHHGNYSPVQWWDGKFYLNGVSDAKTISAGKNQLTAAYHYASLELLISRFLLNHNLKLPNKIVADLGSGAGHWIDFYLKLGVQSCVGIEVSSQAQHFLINKYAGDPRVKILGGLIVDILSGFKKNHFDLVNAIGVMFHIMDDCEWELSLKVVGKCLKPGGLFIVGGHFGFLNKINVQFDDTRTANKRLRSRPYWKKNWAGLDFIISNFSGTGPIVESKIRSLRTMFSLQ